MRRRDSDPWITDDLAAEIIRAGEAMTAAKATVDGLDAEASELRARAEHLERARAERAARREELGRIRSVAADAGDVASVTAAVSELSALAEVDEAAGRQLGNVRERLAVLPADLDDARREYTRRLKAFQRLEDARAGRPARSEVLAIGRAQMPELLAACLARRFAPSTAADFLAGIEPYLARLAVEDPGQYARLRDHLLAPAKSVDPAPEPVFEQIARRADGLPIIREADPPRVRATPPGPEVGDFRPDSFVAVPS